MTFKTMLRAGLVGFAVACSAPAMVGAEVLTIMNGAASGLLSVSTNRAVVVESEEPFAELSIANPGIADISTLSDRTIYVLGKAPGRTTLTLLGPDGRLITNVDVQVSPDTAEFKERLEQIILEREIPSRRHQVLLQHLRFRQGCLPAALSALARQIARGHVISADYTVLRQ